MRHPLRALWLLSAPLLALASESRAVPITVPTSLSPGSQYRLAFVTSTVRDGSSTNIADYNTFVTNAANTVPELIALGTTWTAIASTSTVAAYTNTATNPGVNGTGVPIFLLNDTLLAANNSDLWDLTINVPLAVDETGASCCLTAVWTGTFGNGSGWPGGALGSTNPMAGLTSTTASQWISAGFPGSSTLYLDHLYAISGPLTVPVPEPETASLLALGLIALGVKRRIV